MIPFKSKISIESPNAENLAGYCGVSIAFEVRQILDVTRSGNEFVLSERHLDAPYIKDYDAIPGASPQAWPERFDISKWGMFFARCEGRLVGGAVVAVQSDRVDMLEGRADLAVLWDIRVAPEARGKGAGFALFRAAEDWAAVRGCVELKVETQNVNAPACRFYERQGCVLRAVNPGAYPELPGETQLLWYKAINVPARCRSPFASV
jgi:GNAT superfamily N-acetyltransferase